MEKGAYEIKWVEKWVMIGREAEKVDDEREWAEKLGDGMLGRGPQVNPNVEQRSAAWSC